jgi:beta-mannosidase
MKINLNGTWNVSRANLKKPVPATVPGCIHTDLLSAGIIDNPYYRDNENLVQWIGETDWTYSRRFDVDARLLRHDRVMLRCDGLDTFASVRINDRPAGTACNMFRVWEYDVKRLLLPGRNHIEITFKSTIPYIRNRTAERSLPGWLTVSGSAYVRKEPCNYGWDWGPKLITCGIWRDIYIETFNKARISDIRIFQDHSVKNKVSLTVDVDAGQRRNLQLTCIVKVSLGSVVVTEKKALFQTRRARASLEIKAPKLWWPAGMGEQPLYTVTASIVDHAGNTLDTASRRIGLRTLRLVQKDDEWGRSFLFSVNGTPFFAKGANWIPADTFVTRLTREDYARLISDARAANMNMLRAWGGGIFEQDWFYDICDEAGICVWQDFIFSCSSYPSFDAEWMANVRQEISENIRRLRHHPCIALWCGNNEIEQGILGAEWDESRMGIEDYVKLFDRLIPDIIAQEDPGRDYWPCSPHTPVGDRYNANDQKCGDAHLWGVWHGQNKFTEYQKWFPRFASEFGFQSFPEPRTVASYTLPCDRNVTSYVMEHHQRSGIGNPTIMRYMLDWFRLPSSFDMTLWLSQILQATGMKMAIEHWRRSMPRCMGTLIWQINDCWPVASWSSIDSQGRWKALHYAAKRFYAPVLVSSPGPSPDGKVELHVTSDLAKPRHGVLKWELTDTAGKRVASGGREIVVRARSSRLIETLDMQSHIDKIGARNAVLWVTIEDDGKYSTRNTVLFAPPKHIDFEDPQIRVDVTRQADKIFSISVTGTKPAMWVWLSHEKHDLVFSDNFFDLKPGITMKIFAGIKADISASEFKSGLVIKSLIDTYS